MCITLCILKRVIIRSRTESKCDLLGPLVAGSRLDLEKIEECAIFLNSWRHGNDIVGVRLNVVRWSDLNVFQICVPIISQHSSRLSVSASSQVQPVAVGPNNPLHHNLYRKDRTINTVFKLSCSSTMMSTIMTYLPLTILPTLHEFTVDLRLLLLSRPWPSSDDLAPVARLSSAERTSFWKGPVGL